MRLISITPYGSSTWTNDWDTLAKAKRFAPPWMFADGIHALVDESGTVVEADANFQTEFSLPVGRDFAAVPAECLLSWLGTRLSSAPYL